MKTFDLKGLASNKTFFEGRCSKLIVPAPDGQKEILANHENMVIAITEGMLQFQPENSEEWIQFVVGTGFVQVINNRVVLLVDTAERPEEIDIRRAEEQLRQKQSIEEYHISKASLARAMSRLKATSKYR